MAAAHGHSERKSITSSQSETSPVNSETLKQQHMEATQHYSVHGPMRHHYKTKITLTAYNTEIQPALLTIFIKYSQATAFFNVKTESFSGERKRLVVRVNTVSAVGGGMTQAFTASPKPTFTKAVLKIPALNIKH